MGVVKVMVMVMGVGVGDRVPKCTHF